MWTTHLANKNHWGAVDWDEREIELSEEARIPLWLPQLARDRYPLRTEYREASREKKGNPPKRSVVIEASLGIYRGEEASPISRPAFCLQWDERQDTSSWWEWELRALRALLFDDKFRWVPSVVLNAAAKIEVVLLNDKLYPDWAHYYYPIIGLHINYGRCLASWRTMLWWDMWWKWHFLREGGLPPGTARK